MTNRGTVLIYSTTRSEEPATAEPAPTLPSQLSNPFVLTAQPKVPTLRAVSISIFCSAEGRASKVGDRGPVSVAFTSALRLYYQFFCRGSCLIYPTIAIFAPAPHSHPAIAEEPDISLREIRAILTSVIKEEGLAGCGGMVEHLMTHDPSNRILISNCVCVG